MSPENTKKLYDKYPKIFAQKDLTVQQSCMPWGFECGDGWYWLIDNLCDTMQRYINSNKKEQVEATQVKEKFGTLSFYTTGSNRLIDGMLWLAEDLSGGICETCGSTKDVTQTSGWIKTICKECLNKKEKKDGGNN